MRRPIVCIILCNYIIFIIMYVYAVNKFNQSINVKYCIPFLCDATVCHLVY